MESIIEILMERDGMTESEAVDLVEECRALIFEEGLDPEEVLYEHLGLEPDYLYDLI